MVCLLVVVKTSILLMIFLSEIGFDCEVITTEMDMSAYEIDESYFYKES